MPNGFEEFATNAMALSQRWRQQRDQHRLATAMGQFDKDPQAAIAGVTAVDPTMGYNMRRQVASDAQDAAAKTQALADAHRTATVTNLKTITGYLRSAAEQPGATPDSIGQAYDSLAPVMSSGLGMQPGEIAQWRDMVTKNPSMLAEMDDKLQVVPPGAAVTRGGHEVYKNSAALKTLLVHRGDGGTDVITIDPSTGQPVANGGGATAPSAAVSSGTTDPSQAWAFTAKHEGGYAAHDANGAPVNFGINQTANPGVDVKNLTAPQAQQLFQTKYFGPSGAANLPPALGILHADTYYMNPKRAQQFLQQSGGDPQKYLALRAAWQNNLVRSNPGRFGKYANAWDHRNTDLSSLISGNGPTNDVPPSPYYSGGGGGPQPVYSTPGKPAAPGKPVSKILTTQDITDINSKGGNLNPAMTWMIDHNGDYKMVGPASQLPKPQDQTKVTQQYDLVNNGLDRMKSQVQALMQHPGLDRAVGVGSYFPSIHGGQAANFESQLKSLKSQIMISVLQNMKLASPTGAGMGRVTNFEAQQLQNDVAALDINMSPEQMRASLQKVLDYANKTQTMFQREYQVKQSGGGNGPAKQGGTAAPPKAAIDDLRSNPSPQRRQQFDQIFGSGAAKRFLSSGNANADIIASMPIGVKTPYGTRI